MCNACHNMCCGSDEFGGCGCDGCFEEACWSDDNDFVDAFTEDDFRDLECATAARPRRLICEEVRHVDG